MPQTSATLLAFQIYIPRTAHLDVDREEELIKQCIELNFPSVFERQRALLADCHMDHVPKHIRF
jgi:hypothetical protein